VKEKIKSNEVETQEEVKTVDIKIVESDLNNKNQFESKNINNFSFGEVDASEEK